MKTEAFDKKDKILRYNFVQKGYICKNNKAIEQRKGPFLRYFPTFGRDLRSELLRD